MFVLAQVSSTKTSRWGSIWPCLACHWARRRVTLGRSCSLARRLFFEAETRATDQVPQRMIAGLAAALLQFGQDLAQRHIRLPGDAGNNPVPLLQQGERPLAAHRLGGNAATLPLQPRPALHRGLADLKPSRNLSTAHASPIRRNDTFTQIHRIRTSHAGWPPSQPAP